MPVEKFFKVYKYLENYFDPDKNVKPINPCDVVIDGLSLVDINIAFSILNNYGFIRHIN